MSGALTTWFSGQSAPEDQPGPSAGLTVGLALLAYSPIAVLVAAISYVAFNYYRISHKIIAAIAAAYTVPYLGFVFMFGSPVDMLAGYHAPFGRLILAIKDGGMSGFLSDNWWFWLTSQTPMSLAIGLSVGAVVTWWKWIRRPVWEDKEPRPGLIAKRRLKRVSQEIASDINGPDEGRTLGVDTFGHRIVQPFDEFKAHGLIAGGAGAGKTTTLMVGVRDAIRRGEPVCIIDMKGSADVPQQTAEWCERYDRRFLHWTITDPQVGYKGPADGPAFYDPIGRGDPSRKKDLLIGAEKWDVEYYKSINENYLQIAFQIAALAPNPNTDAFTDLAAILNIDTLAARCLKVFMDAPKDIQGQQLAATHGAETQWWTLTHHVTDEYTSGLLLAAAGVCIKPGDGERSAISNMSARIQKLRMSTAGHWLKRDHANGRDIDLRAAADNGWVVVFSLDSSNYKATSAQIGGLIVQDLNTLSSELRHNPAPTPFHIYLDEFSAIGSDNVLDLLARGRDSRMPTTLSTQALGDLRKVDPAFLDQVLGIINFFILHRANTEDDAEVFAGLTGKKMGYVKRYNVEMASGMPGGIGTGAATGQGNVEQREDYVVPSSAFQSLAPGQMIYIANAPAKRVINPVKVIREDPLLVAHAMATGAKDATSTAVVRDTAPFGINEPSEDESSPWAITNEDLPDAAPVFLPPREPIGPATPTFMPPTAPLRPSVAQNPTLTPGVPFLPAPQAPVAPPQAPVESYPPVETDWRDDTPELDFSEPVRPARPEAYPDPTPVRPGDEGPLDDFDVAVPFITIPGVDDLPAATTPTAVQPLPAAPVVPPMPPLAPRSHTPTPAPTPAPVAPPVTVPPAENPFGAEGGAFGVTENVDWEATAFHDE